MKLLWISGLALALLLVLLYWAWTPDKSRAYLESRYLRAPGDLVDVAGTRLHLRDEGPREAPAVLFLHGFGASLQTWDDWAADLARDHRALRFDLPGSGLSAPDPTGVYTDARTIEIMLALLDARGIERASIVGNSIGGRIAWTFAATHPERMAKLVLISPDGFASPGFEYGKAPEVGLAVELMRWTLPRLLLRLSLAPAYVDPSAMTEARVTRYHELMLGPGSREAMIARMAQTVLVDPVPLLKRITAPTLLLWGEQDALIPFANSEEYLRAIPDVRRVPLPGIGHLPQEEAPARTLPPLRAFLDQPATTPG